MADTGNVRGDLNTIREADTSNLTQSRVRLLRGHGTNSGADTTLLGAVQIRILFLLRIVALQQCGSGALGSQNLTAFAYKLVKSRHFVSPFLMMNIGQFPTFLPHFPFRDAQQLYNTRFDLECQQFFQKNLQLFSSLSVLPQHPAFSAFLSPARPADGRSGTGKRRKKPPCGAISHRAAVAVLEFQFRALTAGLQQPSQQRQPRRALPHGASDPRGPPGDRYRPGSAYR